MCERCPMEYDMRQEETVQGAIVPATRSVCTDILKLLYQILCSIMAGRYRFDEKWPKGTALV